MSTAGEYLLELTAKSGDETKKFFEEHPDSHKLGAAQGFAFGWLLGATDQFVKFARPIPVGERLPEVGQRVLIFSDDSWGPDVSGWHSAKLSPDYLNADPSSCNGGFHAIVGPCHWRLKEITHWLPMLPKPTDGYWRATVLL